MKLCKKCGETKDVSEFGSHPNTRDGLRPGCRSCVNLYVAANSWKTKAKKKAYDAARYAANPERRVQYKAAWHKANAERLRERQRIASALWRKANPERARDMPAKWRTDNPDRVRENGVKWRAANPDAVRVYSHNRRARKRMDGGKVSTGISDKLFNLQRGRCACGCKQPLGDDYQLDHIMPLKLGGTNTDDNIQLLRATCNRKKGAKHPIYFMQTRGFLL